MADTFTALILEQHENQVSAEVRSVPRDALPAGDVLVRVAYSGLNYKDGLAIRGKNKVVRSYPMVPGIDFVGTVEESASPAYAPGDAVILTGWGVGERHWGGMAQYARVKSVWLVPLPDGLTPRDAMAIGTAGFTAMLSLLALEERGLAPDGREVLVTGASGGVGSLAVALLAALGYSVVASTGRADAHDYLRALGAKEIIDRAPLTAESGPMGSARWAGAIDTVGGATLPGVIRTLAPNASVAACGNAGGFDLPTSVLPFILRGVNLLGINSLDTPLEHRKVAWGRLARELPRDTLQRTAHVVPLREAIPLAEQILRSQVRGHTVIDVNA
ncbi:MAG TPA: MDR family oxidoreductase [Ktedonobacterales bacterium]|nr:MDR family oxidoreductase [Ktedonobacterales bacterium]